jgi:hypothetical protein
VQERPDPQNYRQAMSCPDAEKWKMAIKVETDGLFARKVFDVVDAPTNQTILSTTLVFKIKKDPITGDVTFKARLCLRGDQQKEGIDYFKNKTYSAVLNCRETRLIYALAASNDWHLTRPISHKRLRMASLMFLCFAVLLLDMIVLLVRCSN